jgi:DNA-binding NtrC family response regulator
MNNMKIKYQSELCFSTEVMDALTSYAWPGNFRELHNTVEILFIAGKPRIELKDLPIWVCSTNKYKSMEKRGSSYYDSMAFFEMSFFNSLLERNDGKINQSAQIAGISKGTLISKLRKYGINRKEFKKVFTNIAG